MNLHFMKRFLIATLIIAGFMPIKAQLAVKSNLLYDALTTPNIGVETAVASNQTINLVYGLNPWTYHEGGEDHKAKHWVVMPEWRWWPCSTFNGHFVGVHAMGGQMNVSNIHLPIPGGFFGGDNLRHEVQSRRVQGGYAGAGVTYGYQWILNRHWNIEAEIGVGYDHVWYDLYNCGECGAKLKSGHSNYAGVTKAGVSFLYIF